MTDRAQEVADESEIRNLLNRVANLSDGDDLDEYLSCFTEDGDVAIGTVESVGHDQIRAELFGAKPGCKVLVQVRSISSVIR